MNQSLEKLLDGFADDQIEEGRADNTISAYRGDIIQFVAAVGMPDAWNTKAVEDFKKGLLAQRTAISTINRRVIAVRRFIKFLNENGFAVNAKCRTVKIQSQDFLQDVITADDTEKIIRAAIERKDYLTWAIIATLQKTGGRISEVLQLRVGDIGKPKVQVIGKGGKVRSLLVPPSLTSILQLYAGERSEANQSLFMNPKTGRAYTRQRIDQIIKKYAKLTRVKRAKAHAHSFRHQHGQRLKALGLTSENIAEIDGHNSTKTTDIYTKLTERELMAFIDKL
jgi:site-specific recombinase XerD